LRASTPNTRSNTPTLARRSPHAQVRGAAKAVYRALKRAVAREIYRALAGRCEVPDYSDLRPARRAKNITLTAVATQLGVWPARVGELELGRRRDDEFANRYRAWLNAA